MSDKPEGGDNVVNIAPGPLLLSVSAFCVESQSKEETISRRLKVARIEPEQTKGRAKLYRLADLLKCAYLIDDDGQPNPAGMDPYSRKAHYQAQSEEVNYLAVCGELVPKIQMQEEMARAAKVFIHGCDIRQQEYSDGLAGTHRAGCCNADSCQSGICKIVAEKKRC